LSTAASELRTIHKFLQFAVNGSFMKLFTTKCKDTVHA